MLDFDVEVHGDSGFVDAAALVGALENIGLACFHRVHLFNPTRNLGQISHRYFLVVGGEDC